MKYKNYYKILGLSGDKATDDEIKMAYRNLAKKYHPDINGGDEVIAEKFKEVNEAYQILGNSESRKKYDRVYFAYKFKDSFGQTKKKINSENALDEIVSMFFGKKEEPSVRTNLDKNNTPQNGEDMESEISISIEEAFFGTEKKIAFKNEEPNAKAVVVAIPRGIRDGEKIRLQGLGKSGKNNGLNGDLYIKVNIAKHKRFKLDGNNLIIDLPISPWEAVLGTKVEVNSIDSNLVINVPNNVTSGEKLKVSERGFIDKQGKRGDLLLDIKIMTPKNPTNEEKKLFEELGRVSKYSPRED